MAAPPASGPEVEVLDIESGVTLAWAVLSSKTSLAALRHEVSGMPYAVSQRAFRRRERSQAVLTAGPVSFGSNGSEPAARFVRRWLRVACFAQTLRSLARTASPSRGAWREASDSLSFLRPRLPFGTGRRTARAPPQLQRRRPSRCARGRAARASRLLPAGRCPHRGSSALLRAWPATRCSGPCGREAICPWRTHVALRRLAPLRPSWRHPHSGGSGPALRGRRHVL